ncbi:uncharacterized protein ARMOST_15237 [Armillaria ostoyae]|uniref:Uncharacterized protein n=1 Tax=Armillaria ostoyae TaxID=47428 RepID=A0A284RSU3_ARMOS|nr:uncharacterized protein ARMOST_15237 [Armillaria ostoyae]
MPAIDYKLHCRLLSASPRHYALKPPTRIAWTTQNSVLAQGKASYASLSDESCAVTGMGDGVERGGGARVEENMQESQYRLVASQHHARLLILTTHNDVEICPVTS